jgi:hypothetical protein
LKASTCSSVVVPCFFTPYAIKTGSEIDRAPAMTTSAEAWLGAASVATRTAPKAAASASGTVQRTHLKPRACLTYSPV